MEPQQNNQPVQPTMPQQPQAPAQPPQQSQPDAPQQPVQNQPQDPGKTMAIVSLVLGFFLPLIGLILAIVAKSKSKKAGHKNTVAVVSIVINALLIFFQLIMILLIFASFGAVQNEARDVVAKNDIEAIHSQLETFYGNNGYYPGSLSDLASTELSISEESFVEPNSDYEYSYLTSPVGCSDDCTSYQLQVTLSDGTSYIKESTN